jgi:hypoxanthine-DNA glycosylase
MVVFNSYSFPPILGENPRILVLGSMPGIASLKAQQYYAHPRNAFWPIMARLCGFDIDQPYDKRCEQLTKEGIAVWDVLAACYRPGSLDQNIDETAIQTNDFNTLIADNPSIKRICFNGQKAAALFKKNVIPKINLKTIQCLTLPSTSPAHASKKFEEKLMNWQTALNF